MCNDRDMSEFKPWIKYPSVTQERLALIASIIRRVRSETVALHDPGHGDNAWSLGCRIYTRTCFAIRAVAKDYPWLTILHESEDLRFSFAFGEVPVRFYTGDADNPPDRYVHATFGELQHLQAVLPIEGIRSIDNVLRLAVEPDNDRKVLSVTLVEMDQSGQPTEKYTIPFELTDGSNITSLQAKPIDLPPPAVKPIKNEEKQSQRRGKTVNERKLGS
jgi:hypothetical protein